MENYKIIELIPLRKVGQINGIITSLIYSTYCQYYDNNIGIKIYGRNSDNPSIEFVDKEELINTIEIGNKRYWVAIVKDENAIKEYVNNTVNSNNKWYKINKKFILRFYNEDDRFDEILEIPEWLNNNDFVYINIDYLENEGGICYGKN